MKTLVFSDSHLETVIEEKKYRFLENLITEADRVIINGDFWDGFFVSFSEFVDSPYRTLFPLLKKKKTIYLTGNHDSPDLLDSRTSLFAEKTVDKYEMIVGKKKFVFQHGDKQIPIFQTEIPVLEKHRRLIARSLDNMEYYIVRHLGKPVSRMIQGGLNNTIKKTIKTQINKEDIFICGHTHLAEFSLPEQFVNSGMVNHGLGQYLIIENDTIVAKEEWYQ